MNLDFATSFARNRHQSRVDFACVGGYRFFLARCLCSCNLKFGLAIFLIEIATCDVLRESYFSPIVLYCLPFMMLF